MSKYKFPCGCEFDVINDKIKECDGLPALSIDYYNLPLDCPATWELIQSGKTKGIFQLETNLGKKWSKELHPEYISHLSALIALIRPGVLKAIVDGKSMAQKYCDRKNAKEEVSYFHKALEPILQDTYSIMLFQEQAMKIAQDIAGFTLEEADSLRKAIGKKLPELMAKIKIQFIDGCKKVGIVTEDIAEQIFGWIQESQRYSFNACLSPTTIVEAIDKLKTLEEVQIGDFIKAPSDDLSQDTFVEVVDKFDNGKQMLYEIELESGLTIQCTLDHKFLCDDGKIRPLIEIIDEKHKIGV